jgi:hypothetical protein
MVFKEDKKFSKIFSSGLGHTFRVFSHSLDTVSTGQIHVWYEFDTVWTEIWINFNLIKKNFHKQVVLITGAGGSIGSELSVKILEQQPKKIILLDNSEYNYYKHPTDCSEFFGQVVGKYFIPND